MSSVPKKVKPGLFTIKESRWYWVWLPELAEVIGWTPEKIIDAFGDLVKEVHVVGGVWRTGELHWIGEDGQFCCCGQGNHTAAPSSNIYVPAGFSNDVLHARELGVIALKRIHHASSFPLEGSLRDFWSPDPTNQKNRRLAIVGMTSRSTTVRAPLGERFPLLG